MNKLTAGVLDIAEQAKPVLKKFIPQRTLTKAKLRLLARSYQEIVAQGRKPFDRSTYPDGINLLGLLQARMGLGQSCRLLAQTLQESALGVSLYNFELPVPGMDVGEHEFDGQLRTDFPYNINLIHINPEQMILLYTRLPKETWDHRYNIAFWLWELREIPKEWLSYLPMLDEIWTPSEFVSENLRRVTDLPVYTMPYWVTAQTDPAYDRAYFHLPKKRFLFLCMYDSNSTMERKNPMGAVRAFAKAFAPDDRRVGLVIKVNNARKEDLGELKKALAGRRNVRVITRTMEKTEVNSLIADCDVFVSLHRAEGFGLVMAEAMLVGTPCIATNYSSNTEFMNPDVACMVDYTLTTLQKNSPPYEKGVTWADPDIDQAADYMRHLAADPDDYAALAKRAQAYAAERMGREQAVERIRKRVKEIYETI